MFPIFVQIPLALHHIFKCLVNARHSLICHLGKSLEVTLVLPPVLVALVLQDESGVDSIPGPCPTHFHSDSVVHTYPPGARSRRDELTPVEVYRKLSTRWGSFSAKEKWDRFFGVKRLHIVSVPRAGSQDFECRRGRGSGLAVPLATAAWASSGAHRAGCFAITGSGRRCFV